MLFDIRIIVNLKSKFISKKFTLLNKEDFVPNSGQTRKLIGVGI